LLLQSLYLERKLLLEILKTSALGEMQIALKICSLSEIVEYIPNISPVDMIARSNSLARAEVL